MHLQLSCIHLHTYYLHLKNRRDFQIKSDKITIFHKITINSRPLWAFPGECWWMFTCRSNQRPACGLHVACRPARCPVLHPPGHHGAFALVSLHGSESSTVQLLHSNQGCVSHFTAFVSERIQTALTVCNNRLHVLFYWVKLLIIVTNPCLLTLSRLSFSCPIWTFCTATVWSCSVMLTPLH